MRLRRLLILLIISAFLSLNISCSTASNEEGADDGSTENQDDITIQVPGGVDEINGDQDISPEDEQPEERPGAITNVPTRPDEYAVKKWTADRGVIRVMLPKEEIVVNITSIDNKKYPLITLYVSVTDINGAPLEVENINEFYIEENGVPLPSNNIAEVIQQKNTDLTTPVNVVLAIDKSGSMADDGARENIPIEEQPITFAKDAAVSFIRGIGQSDTVECVAFDGDLHPLGLNADAIESIQSLEARGSTALYGALYQSVLNIKDKSGINAVVLLSDGKNDTGASTMDWLKEIDLEEGIDLANEYIIPVYTIAFGGGADTSTLRQIADDTHATFFETGNKEELETLYENIRQIINNQYVIVYETSSLDFSDIYVEFGLGNDTRIVTHEGIPNREQMLRIIAQQEELEQLRQELNQEQERLNEERTELETWEEDLKVREQELIERQQEMENKRSDLEDWEENLNQLEGTLNDMAESNSDRDAELNQMNEQLNQRAATLEQRARDLEQQAQLLDSKENQLNTLSSNLDNRTDELNQRETQLNGRNQRLDQMQTNLNSREQDLNTREANLNRIQQNLQALENSLDQREAELDEFQASLETRRQELNNQATQLQNQRNNLNQISARLTSQQEDLQAESQRLDRQESQLENLQTQLNQRQQQLEQRANRLSQMESDLEAQAQQLQAQSRQLQAFEQTLDQERAENERIRMLIQQVVSEIGTTVEDLENQVNE